MTDTRYEEGDAVATPNGRGVVSAVLTDDFEFPQGADDLADVPAADDRPAYVVGLERGGSAVYRASALEATTFDVPETEVPAADGDPETEIVDEDVDGVDELPEGWDYESLHRYWHSIGGTWEDCFGDLADEWEDDRAREHCSAVKDEVLGTTRWRNRF